MEYRPVYSSCTLYNSLDASFRVFMPQKKRKKKKETSLRVQFELYFIG